MWTNLLIFISGVLFGLSGAWVVSRYAVARALAKARIAERRAQGAERLAELGAMTGGLAHEIKNPLSTIGLNAQLLGEAIDELTIPDEDKSRLTRRLGALKREADRLKGILTDFLEFAGEVRLDLSTIDLNQVVGEMADFFLPQAEQARVRLRTDLASEDLRVVADGKHVKQALLNLMLNAVQAFGSTDGPRELILKTHLAREPDGSRAAAIHVIDTGPGIASDHLPRIFTPYFTTKSGGTGLGLPTTKRLIEAHGGRLEVHTSLGHGTDFTVILPVDGPTPRPARPGA